MRVARLLFPKKEGARSFCSKREPQVQEQPAEGFADNGDTRLENFAPDLEIHEVLHQDSVDFDDNGDAQLDSFASGDVVSGTRGKNRVMLNWDSLTAGEENGDARIEAIGFGDEEGRVMRLMWNSWRICCLFYRVLLKCQLFRARRISGNDMCGECSCSWDM
ncbi:uncharacterized protein LOC121253342 [Juglans microcarpa x Juglans regia]|uniref:uncharacterized protein LOC121253342 n=1 Tax=Juglans microcarpa x Juglans regia TaxID=2249226 RepID=UPI001B7E215B|nr:uncharacterized protein LOC121253342 [Juglans microcarpa x Juglans regia]